MITSAALTGKHTHNSQAHDLVLERFHKGRLVVRIADAEKENKKSNTPKPTTILRPGDHRVLTFNDKYFDFTVGANRVVVILDAPEKQFLWAYKRDAGTDDKGECMSSLMSRHNKKITDFSTLDKRVTETADREHSLFLPLTSGHLSNVGYLPIKTAGNFVHSVHYNYPEVIFDNYNFDTMHTGYLLDFARECCFQRLADVMENILTIEANKTDEPFSRPIYCFDSQRGRLTSQQYTSKDQLVTIRDNALALSQYELLTGLANTPGPTHQLGTYVPCYFQ